MPPAHILIVEPHAAEVQGLARSLAHEHRVSILASAAAAWELLGAAHPPDLLVLDVDDRSGAGFELARMLRDERRYARLPVVLTSARLDPQIESLGLQLGAAEVLGKPLQVEITRLRLNALLERTRLALALDRSLSAGGLALWEGTTRQCRFTEGASELLGWDQGQQFDWRELAHPQDLLKLEAALARVLMSEPPRPPMDGARAGARAGPAAGHWATTAPAPDQLVLDLRLRHRGGGWRWVALQGRLLAEDLPGSDATAPSATDTAAGRLAGTLLDIGRRKQLEAALREREAGLSALMGSLHDLVMVVDANGRVMSCHLPAEFELALPEPPWLGRSYEELLPAGIAGPLHEALAGLALDGRRRSFECDWPAPGQSPDDAADTGAAPAATQGADEAQSGGRLRHGLASVSLVQTPLDPALQEFAPPGGGALLVLRDATEHRVAEEAVRQLAYFDPLTALPNRRLLQDRLRQAQVGSRRRGRHAALIFIDLDHFKRINDAHGHQAGDQLLVELARRLQVSVRACDTVARLGGDEFVVVLTDLDADEAVARQQLAQIASKMLGRLARSYELEGHRHVCTASLGAALFIGTEPGNEALVARADAAMYAAKAAGRNRAVVTDALGRHDLLPAVATSH